MRSNIIDMRSIIIITSIRFILIRTYGRLITKEPYKVYIYLYIHNKSLYLSLFKFLLDCIFIILVSNK